MQPGMREMDLGETIIPFAPGFCRAFDIAEHGGRNGFAVHCGKKRQHARLLASQASQAARHRGSYQHSAGAKYETFCRQYESRGDRHGAQARLPRRIDVLTRQGNSPWLGNIWRRHMQSGHRCRFCHCPFD
jgi:hypothetical protein